MASSARHARSTPRSPLPRALWRAGLTVSAAGAALAIGGAAGANAASPEAAPVAAPDDSAGHTGHQAPRPEGQAVADVLPGTVANVLRPVTDLQLDPYAGTAIDPLANTVGTQIADFRAIDTSAVTGPLSDGAALSDLGVIGPVLKTVTG